MLAVGGSVVVGLLTAVNAQVDAPATNTEVDALFARWSAPDSPGCGVGLSRDGVTLYERAYGMANLELNVPLSSGTVFNAASISKLFTAMSVTLLAERGRLSFDDEVRAHIPELPDYGRPLTIRHLLGHSGGLRDAFILLELSAPEGPEWDQNAALLRVLARQRALNFLPGEELQYSNGGYALLATIVQRVSGQTLAEFARDNIFVPLGMTGTRFNDDPAVLIPNRAAIYTRRDDAWRIPVSNMNRNAVGNSGLWTSVPDLLRWARDLAEPRVGSVARLAEMQTPGPLTTPEKMRWGLGFEVGSHAGATFVGHGGGGWGIDNFFAWFPEQRLAVVVLCNADETSSRRMGLQIAERYLPRASPAQTGAAASATTPAAASSTPASAARAEWSAANVARRSGLYRVVDGDVYVRIFARDGQLRGAIGTGMGDSFPLVAVSPTRATIDATPFAFEFFVTGPNQEELRSFDGTTETGRFQRLDAFAPSDATLREYAGRYRSDELGVEWTLVVRGSTFGIQRPARPETLVDPIAADMFTTAIADHMRFVRDAAGAVSGFTLISDGLRSLTFERVGR